MRFILEISNSDADKKAYLIEDGSEDRVPILFWDLKIDDGQSIHSFKRFPNRKLRDNHYKKAKEGEG